MKLRRLAALLLAVILVLSLVGCDKETKEVVSNLPSKINEIEVDVIDDMPDWEGSELDLSVWYAYGTNNYAAGRLKKDDKFQNEMKRISGISLSEEKSFDNSGGSCDTVIAKLASTKAWPHVGVMVEESVMKNLIESDKLYDVSEYIPKYMPNYMSYINSHEKIRAKFDKRYSDPTKKYTWASLSNQIFKYIDPEYSQEKYAPIAGALETMHYVWIRDDVLKKLYPEAHTVKELEDIYVKNGKFTEDEILDVSIDSMEEFKELLVDIKNLNIVEDGIALEPFYTSNGTDNWDLFAFMDALAGSGPSTDINYFTYWDAGQKKIVNTAKQEWFKDYAYFCNSLYREGLASEEAFIDTKGVFDQKKNNGNYAIIYGIPQPPTKEVMQAAGKDAQYRKLYVNIPMDYSRFVQYRTENFFEIYPLCFFKDALSETQLEQILRFLDFFYTDAGMKFANWGSKKAGLYEEKEDGSLIYTDKKFEAARVFNGDDQVLYDYGWSSFPLIEKFISATGVNKYQPKMIYANYDTERKPSDYITKFSSVYIDEAPDYPALDFGWNIWSYASSVKGVETFWNARQATEDALKSLIASKSDKEFEKNYANLIAIEERNGLDDKCLEEMNKLFEEKNADCIEELRNWKAK